MEAFGIGGLPFLKRNLTLAIRQVVETGNMTSEAAMTKLMWALGQCEDPARVREIMNTNLLGEMGNAGLLNVFC